jgi:serine protease Do
LGVREPQSRGLTTRNPRLGSAVLFRLVLFLLALAAPAAADTSAVPTTREQVKLSFAPVVKRTAQAVVNVFSRRVVRQGGAPSALFDDPLFRRFFGDAIPFGLPQERVQNSLGSGVIVGRDGLIVTNNHVIRGADEVTVVLADRREFEATILRRDERTDLAVLKIDVKDDALPFVELGDSDALEVGDLVLAIGNPFGVGQTVTSGIVSALARTRVGISDFRFFIQTDAAINPGNSGGALVDLDGKLVGINTAIYSRSGGSIGIGFAIPTAMVRAVVAGAADGGRIMRPWLGASGQPVTNDLAQSLGLKRPVGVLVKEVAQGSPAAEAGLKIGDLVLTVNGHEVEDDEALRFRIATQPVGSTAALTLWRDGAERSIRVRLAAPPETPPRDITELRGRHPLAGAKVANLSPAFADELGLDLAGRGVIVLGTSTGSVAQRLGLEPGDIVAGVNGRAIGTVEQLRERLREGRAPWAIAIKRGDRLLNLQVQG